MVGWASGKGWGARENARILSPVGARRLGIFARPHTEARKDYARFLGPRACDFERGSINAQEKVGCGSETVEAVGATARVLLGRDHEMARTVGHASPERARFLNFEFGQE